MISVPKYLQMKRKKNQNFEMMDAEDNEGYEPHHHDNNFIFQQS